jgi:hypothetical protein
MKSCQTCRWSAEWEEYEKGNLMGKCKWGSENDLPDLPKCALVEYRKLVHFVKAEDNIMNIQNCPTWEKKGDRNEIINRRTNDS